MRRRFFYLSLIIIILLSNVTTIPCEAKAADMYVNARCAIAMDVKGKIVLYEKNSHDIVPMASTTKIMTALVAIKYGDLDKKVEISEKAANINGSTVGYKKGAKVSLRELLVGLMLRSGNDAAVAISEGIAGNVEGFVKLMNEYGSEVGLIDTHFESPHGLDSDYHYTTAYDLALVTAKAKENAIFNEIVSSKNFDGKEYGFTRSYQNINKILWLIPDSNGVKTGYTGKAGKCLVSSVKVDGNDVVIVVLNCTPRWEETKKINDYIEKNYSYKKLFSKGDVAGEIETQNGNVKMLYGQDIVIPMMKDKNYYVKLVKPELAKKKVKNDEDIGRICIYSDDILIYSDSLKAAF